MRAAGRAILLLIEEVERLNVDLWHATRLRGEEGAPEAAAADEPADDLRTTLRRRLGAFRYEAPSSPSGEP